MHVSHIRLMERTEQEIYQLHQEITFAFEESMREGNKDWLHHFWQTMMEDGNLTRQELIDFMLDELNRGNSGSEEMLRSILAHS